MCLVPNVAYKVHTSRKRLINVRKHAYSLLRVPQGVVLQYESDLGH